MTNCKYKYNYICYIYEFRIKYIQINKVKSEEVSFSMHKISNLNLIHLAS